MNWRPYIVVGVLVTALGVDVFLAATEEIEAAGGDPSHSVEKPDPLHDLAYVASDRLTNLRRMGLSDQAAEVVIRRIGGLSQYSDGLRSLLRQAPEGDLVPDALCGQSQRGLPARWGALDFLVEQKAGELRVVNITDLPFLVAQGWVADSRVQSVYRRTERRESRPDDATKMGLAAVLAGKHEALLTKEAPWGAGGILGGWSWNDVVAEHRGIENTLYDYLALMHLTVELAQGEGGICGK